MSYAIQFSSLNQGGWQSNWKEQRELQNLEQAFAGSGPAPTPQPSTVAAPNAPATTPSTSPGSSTPAGPSNITPAATPPDPSGSGNSLIQALSEIEQGIQSLVVALQHGDSAIPPVAPQGPTAAPGSADETSGPQSSLIVTAFNALGQALQSGDLDGAQKAFSTLQQDLQPGGQPSPPANGDKIVQAFNHLGQALQSGDLSGAQQAFSALQQDLQPGTGWSGHRHHHHHHSSPGEQDNSLAGAFESLSRALHTGDLAAAQKAYTTLQQDLEPGTSISTADTASGPAPSSTPLSATA